MICNDDILILEYFLLTAQRRVRVRDNNKGHIHIQVYSDTTPVNGVRRLTQGAYATYDPYLYLYVYMRRKRRRETRYKVRGKGLTLTSTSAKLFLALPPLAGGGGTALAGLAYRIQG